MGEVLSIFIEVLFEIVKVNKSSTALQEEKKIDRKIVNAISFDFIVNLNGFCLNTNFWIVWISFYRFKDAKVQRNKANNLLSFL